MLFYVAVSVLFSTKGPKAVKVSIVLNGWTGTSNCPEAPSLALCVYMCVCVFTCVCAWGSLCTLLLCLYGRLWVLHTATFSNILLVLWCFKSAACSATIRASNDACQMRLVIRRFQCIWFLTRIDSYVYGCQED